MRRALPPPRRPALSRGTAAAEPARRAAARTVGGSSACRSASPVRSSLLLVAPMALAVFGDLLLHAAPYLIHGSSGFTCGHQLGVGFAWTRLMARFLLGRRSLRTLLAEKLLELGDELGG